MINNAHRNRFGHRRRCGRKHKTTFEQDVHAKPKEPFKYVVHRKWFAARVAYQLMHDHGLPINAERKGKFCKLAAILYGEPKADLYHQCGAVLSKGPAHTPRS